MGKTFKTGYLQNLIAYDVSGNITLPGTLTISNNKLVATQEYVSTELASLIGSAPTALNTLNELATALNNDASFATTITNSLAGKQNALSGTGFVKISGTTISYDNSTYLTTSSAASTYLALSGGTLTGALNGTTLSLVGTDNVGIKLKQGNQIFDSPSSTSFYNGLTFENTTTTNAWSIGYAQGAKFSINYFDGASTYSRFLSITTNGTIGVGVLTPERVLDIDATGANAAIRLRKASNNMIFLGTGNSSTSAGTENAILQMHHNGTEKIRLYTEGNSWITGGNLGIGTASPTAAVTVNGNGVGAAIDWTNTTSTTGKSFRWVSLNSGGFAIEDLSDSGNERLRINTTGELIVGASTFPGAGATTTGVGFGPSGAISAQRNAATVGFFGRGTNDGELFALYRGSSQVGAISVTTASVSLTSLSNGGLTITSAGTGIFSNYAFGDAFGATGNNTMSSWGSTPVRPIIEGREGNAISNYVGLPEMYYTSNAYYNGSNWIRKSANASINMVLSGYNNNFIIQSAATGTAGGTATFVSRLYVDGSNGNVGLGITNPQSQLHINGDLTFTESGYNTARLHQIAHTHSNGSSENNNLRFLVSDGSGSTAERMRINGLGNVGINTTTPLEKLSVTGNLHVAGVGNALYFDTDASGRSITQYVTNLYEFHILNGRGNSARFILGNGSISLGTSTTPQLYINTSSGAVLVGTTTRSYSESFIVKGSSSSMGVVRFENNVNQGDVNHGTLMVVNTKAYAIGNDASIAFALQNADNSFTDPRASIGCKTESSYGGALVFNTRLDGGSYTEKMRITGRGRLGLAVSNPDALLHVGGAILVSNGAQTFRRAITCHGQAGTFTQVKVYFNKSNWGSVTYDIKLASAGGSYHTAGAYYSNPGFSSHINSINAGNGPTMSLVADSQTGSTQGAVWTFYGATMIHPMVTVDIACGNGYQVNPDDIVVVFS